MGLEKTAKRQAFVNWYFKDVDARHPRTQVEWCEANNINPATIVKWVRLIKTKVLLPSEGDFDIKEYIRQNLRSITEALVTSAKSGRNMRSVELALKALGEILEKKEATSFEPTASDYTSYGRAVIERLREDYRQHSGICPLCLQPKVLRPEVCLDTEPEHQEG